MLKINKLPTLLACSLIASNCYAEVLNLFTWDNYMADEVIQAFQQETGHHVELFYLENDDERESLIFSGRAANFDLVIIDSQTLNADGSVNHFSNIDTAKVPSVKNLSDNAINACGSQGVAYAWGTVGIAYRESANPEGIHSWMQIFDISAANRHKTMITTDSVELSVFSLLALNLPPFTTNKDHLRQAFSLLKQQQPNLYSYGDGFGHAVDNGENNELTLMIIYSGDLDILIRETKQQDWRYVLPEEGHIVWTDCLAIPINDKAIKQATYDFLNFINRPEIAKLNAETMLISTPNKAALKIASKKYLNNQVLFPPEDIMNKAVNFYYLPNEQLQYRSRMLQKLTLSKQPL